MNAIQDSCNIKMNVFSKVSLRNQSGGLAWFLWGGAWKLYKALEIFIYLFYFYLLQSSDVGFLGQYKANTFRIS